MSNLYDYLNENSQFQSFLENKKSIQETVSDAKGQALASLGENLPLALEVGTRIYEAVKTAKSAGTAISEAIGSDATSALKNVASSAVENVVGKVTGDVAGDVAGSVATKLSALPASTSEATAVTSNLGESLAGRMASRAFEQDPEDIGSFVGNNQSLVESAQAIFRGGNVTDVATVAGNMGSKVANVASDVGEQVASKAASVAGEASSVAETAGATAGEAAGEAAGIGLGAVASTAASILGPVGLIASVGLSIFDIVESFEKTTTIPREAKPVFVSGL